MEPTARLKRLKAALSSIGRKKMKCTLVKQLPNHCVPACLESIAKDNGIHITQTEIVKRYPDVFPKGVLNDFNKPRNLATVVKDLGLADNIYDIPFTNFTGLKELSKDNEILLFWTKISKHCVRFCGSNVDNIAITVMDPEHDQLQTREIRWLDDISPRLIHFKKIGNNPL